MDLRRSTALTATAFGAVFAVLALQAAYAQTPQQTPSPGATYATDEECMNALASAGADVGATCVSGGTGSVWTITSYGGPSTSGFPTALILIAIFWSTLPAIFAGVIASSRGQNTALAVVLGLFLGWLGLAIVVFGFKAEVQQKASELVQTVAHPSQPAADARGDRGAAGRIAELNDLRQRGLITQQEYDSRREAIINEI